MRTVISLLALAVFFAAGCQEPQLMLPSEKYPTTKRIEAPFAEVWEATLEALFVEAPLSVVSREERLIATDWQYGKSDYAYTMTAPFGLGSKDYLDSRWRMNVRLADRGRATTVSVKLIEEARELRGGTGDDYAYSVWLPIESSTKRERKLLSKIESRFRVPERSGQRVKIEVKLDELLKEKEYDKAVQYLRHEIEFNIADNDLKKYFEERIVEVEKLKQGEPEKESP
ncbi:MAG: hypothetical protein ACYS8W_01685 [Planctomycetota bacterium]|jgi:hypothetical protein